MRYNSAYALMMGVSLVALAAPAQSYAQEAASQAPESAAAESTDASEQVIIVQARRRDEDIQDVPSVINAVTASEIADLNLREFTEVKTLAPGLELNTNANGIGGNARMRGVNFDTNASGNNATVEFYYNDAPISAGVILQQMYDIGQIEVQRGPQGTLRGRASPSGSITVTTHKPDLNEFGGFVDGTANDLGTLNFKGALNLPIIEGIAAIRVAGVWDENEVDRVRPTTNAVDGRDPFSRTKSGRISALIEPADWIRLEGSYQYMDRDLRSYDQVESFSVVNPAAPPTTDLLIRAKDRLAVQSDSRQINQRFDIYNWRAEFSGFGQRLIYQGQYSEQRLHSVEPQDPAVVFPGRSIAQVTDSNAVGESHEIRLQNDERVFDIFDYVVGYFDNTLDSPTDLTRPTAIRLPLAFGGGLASVVQTPIARRGGSHEKSFFGNVNAHIGDSLEISGGLRQIEYKDDSQLIVGGALLTDNQNDDDKLIYNASIKYNINPDFLVYASTGSSWRPGINVVGDFNIAQSALEQSFLNLPPESSESYELGFKSTLLDNTLRFNLTAYHQKFKNFPYRVPGTGVYFVNTVPTAQGPVQQVASFNFVGAVPVEVNGIEGELSYDINNDWNVGLFASYSLGKIKNGTIPCNDLNGDGVPDPTGPAPTLAQLQAAVGADNLAACQVNQRASFLPPFSATLQSEYNLAISNKMDGFVRGLFSYYGSSQGDPTNDFDDVGDYGLLNLYTGVRDPDGAWELTLFAKNVFNTTKVLTRTTPLFTSYQQLPGAIINGVPTITGRPSAATTTSSYTGITTTPPQEFGINFRFFFGSR
ncbi:TonB-dependent receptor [Sphingomonas sp. LaA6.9]|uniref:TonB-dependent receptor n=1 Tax=Sphingomonas sp. LaA6.9 TaxID=2919914 RepID=UPI001F4FFFB2|nr:TonB-dependent receptor [Sphingomonas sp. LaA6.9]MCJ8159672.1 TonB-dependent receptor [Sphingomonas sp. LaA6.9]